MGFWQTVWSNVLGGIGAGIFFVLMYILIQWFLHATDLVVSYNWTFNTVNGVTTFRPNFSIRNRSRSRAYRLANIAYTRGEQRHWFDNESLWGFVLEPGSMNNTLQGAPVKDLHSLPEALGMQVTIRLQTGRAFWLRAQGPGQMGRSRIQRAAFAVRDKLESWMMPME